MYKKFYIYRFLDKDDNIIYIGRTNDINRRILKEHFTSLGHLPYDCYKSIEKIEFTEFENESEEVAYEAILINQFKPKYNTQFNDSGDFNVEIPEFKWVDFIFPLENMLNYLKNRKNKTQSISDFILNKMENFFSDTGSSTTGFLEFDNRTPINNTELILVASDVTADNTLYALNICSFMSRNSDKKILYVNLKEDAENLTEKLIAQVSHVSLDRILTNRMTEDEIKLYINAVNTLNKYNIRFANLSYEDKTIDNIIKIIKSQSYDFIVIDDLQSIISSKEIYIKDKTLDIMQKIKSLSMDIKTPVLLLSGIPKNKIKMNADNRPLLEDLEYDSMRAFPDIIKFLYRDEVYDYQSLKKNIMEVILVKDRLYNEYTFELILLGSCCCIANIERPE